MSSELNEVSPVAGLAIGMVFTALDRMEKNARYALTELVATRPGEVIEATIRARFEAFRDAIEGIRAEVRGFVRETGWDTDTPNAEAMAVPAFKTMAQGIRQTLDDEFGETNGLIMMLRGRTEAPAADGPDGAPSPADSAEMLAMSCVTNMLAAERMLLEALDFLFGEPETERAP